MFKKKPKVEKAPSKAFSLAFWMAIPAYFFLGAVCFIAFIVLLDKHLFDEKIWALFAFGFISSLVVIGTSGMTRLRILVHETKHALAVLLTGSSLKDFQVGGNKGEVTYEIPEDQLHYIPMIGLAPYCMPLLSFPVLFVSLFLETYYRDYCTLALGFTLGADIVLAWGELDPRQTDFGSIAGGFFISALFIAGAFFFWMSACLLWVLAGRMGFAYAGFLALRLISLFLAKAGFVRQAGQIMS